MNTLGQELVSPEEILEFLSMPIRELHAGLDHGVSLAEIKMEDLGHDPWLYSHLVRFGARQYLESLYPSDWALVEGISNSGIHILKGPLKLRVMKATLSGTVPSPGKNEARRDFYSQVTPPLPLIIENRITPPSPNHILDWQVDEQHELLLALSCPFDTWNYKGKPHLHWRREIRLETLSQDASIRFKSSDEDIPVSLRYEPEDLEEEDDAR